MDVSRKPPSAGRVRQRRRTRRGILDAARELLERGEPLSIAAVAEAADVSRATAYRYFPSEQALVLELELDRALPAMPALLAEMQGEPVERAVHLQRVLHEHAARNEVAFRHYLKAVQEVRLQGDGGEPPRGGRRIEALEDALGPLRERLDDEEVDRLRHALAALIGIEALLVMRDVCGLDPAQAGAVGEWAVRTLIEGALRRDGYA